MLGDPDQLQLFGQREDDVGVELRPGAALELLERLVRAQRAAIDAIRGHCVVGVDDEDDSRSQRDLRPRQAIRIAVPVPALVVVQDPVGDRLDAKAVEHAEADLRMPLQNEPLGVGERAGLPQDLLRNSELAQVVEAACQACELDQLLVEAEACCDFRGQFGYSRRMAARVRVAEVDGLRQALGCAEARCAVRPVRQATQLGQLDHVGPVDVRAVLAVLLRPIESAVGQTDELEATRRLGREGRHAGADCDRADVVERERGDTVDDGRRCRDRLSLIRLRKQDRELVAAEAEGLAVLTKIGRDLGEHGVSGRVSVQIVDALEVVDVDQAEAEVFAALIRFGQLALDPIVEVAVIAESRQGIGEREAHGPQCAVGGALVERDRQQRPEERDRQERRALPEDDQDERGRPHERENHDRPANAGLDQLEEGRPGGNRDDH